MRSQFVAYSVQSHRVAQVETVLPSHTNMHGTAFGGTVMSWIDSCASLSASRGGCCPVVAAGFDEIAFVAPLRLGEHAIIDSKVTRSWGTSLEVHNRQCIITA
jgi:acyl-CoA hydrolase